MHNKRLILRSARQSHRQQYRLDDKARGPRILDPRYAGAKPATR